MAEETAGDATWDINSVGEFEDCVLLVLVTLAAAGDGRLNVIETGPDVRVRLCVGSDDEPLRYIQWSGPLEMWTRRVLAAAQKTDKA